MSCQGLWGGGGIFMKFDADTASFLIDSVGYGNTPEETNTVAGGEHGGVFLNATGLLTTGRFPSESGSTTPTLYSGSDVQHSVHSTLLVYFVPIGSRFKLLQLSDSLTY